MLASARRLLVSSVVLSATSKAIRMSSSTVLPSKVKLALCQLAVGADKKANIENCLAKISSCVDEDIVVRWITRCVVM